MEATPRYHGKTFKVEKNTAFQDHTSTIPPSAVNRIASNGIHGQKKMSSEERIRT
jgi:hypothetical protein